MYNNDDMMSKLDEVSKDVLEDINVLSNQVHRLRKKIYDEKNLEPEVYVVDVEAITLDTYTLIDFITLFNDMYEEMPVVQTYVKLKLFIDKDKAIEYLKDLEIKNGIKELVGRQ